MRKGFKQTEVAIIPDDWDLKPLNVLTNQIIDGTHFTPKYIELGVPFLRVTDIQDTEIDFNEIKFISPEEHHFLTRRCKPEKGDLLLSKNGTIGIPKIVTWDWEFSIFVSLALLKPKTKLINVQFLEQFFKSEYLVTQIQKRSKQGAVTNLHLEEIREFLIPIPPILAEQEAIAEALSDADALIEAVEQLLAKKHQVKLGAIQELLTGKRRLAGFEKKSGYKHTEVGIIPEDWDAVSIVEICDDKKGSIKIGPFGSQLKREYLVSSGYKVYGQENVYVQDVEIGDRYLTKEHFLKLKSCELLPGDFIVSMMGTIGQCMIVPDGIQQGIIDSHLIRIRLNPKVVVPRYMSYYYSSKLVFDQITRLQVGGIMAGLSSSVIKQIYIGLPNTTKEQTAIAEILSDMDAEITALEEKLVKARQVKAGMMQELLTGKIRLV